MVFEDEFSSSPNPIISDIVLGSACPVTLDCVVLIFSGVSATLNCVVSNEEISVVLDTVVLNEESSPIIYLLGYSSSYIITTSLFLHSSSRM